MFVCVCVGWEGAVCVFSVCKDVFIYVCVCVCLGREGGCVFLVCGDCWFGGREGGFVSVCLCVPGGGGRRRS